MALMLGGHWRAAGIVNGYRWRADVRVVAAARLVHAERAYDAALEAADVDKMLVQIATDVHESFPAFRHIIMAMNVTTAILEARAKFAGRLYRLAGLDWPDAPLTGASWTSDHRRMAEEGDQPMRDEVPEGYILGLGRDYPHPRLAHLYEGPFHEPGLAMCRYGYNRDDGQSYSIWRGNLGKGGVCKVCLKRARAGLKGVGPREVPVATLDGE